MLFKVLSLVPKKLNPLRDDNICIAVITAPLAAGIRHNWLRVVAIASELFATDAAGLLVAGALHCVISSLDSLSDADPAILRKTDLDVFY